MTAAPPRAAGAATSAAPPAASDEALRGEADSGSYSFTGAFERAKVAVTAREKAEGYEPSNPQMFVGNAMREKLKALEARLAGMARPAP